MAVAYLAVRPVPSSPPLPADARALAARVAAHPTDWRAASALTAAALDAPVRDPLALWHASGALAISLAPTMPQPRTGFARSAFFHWNEMNEADRKAVLDAYAPVLRDEMTFRRMYDSIYELTGDFDYLLRARPHSPETSRLLIGLAGRFGRFDRYRALRDEVPPPIPPVDKQSVPAEHHIDVRVKNITPDDVPAYIEIWIDGNRRAEGAVASEQTFSAPVDGGGIHDVEVRLANPVTRNNIRRMVQVTAVRGT